MIKTFSYVGLFGIVFAETGLLIGFFLPGDTLLLTAGIFAARGDVTLFGVILSCFLGAVIGNSVGYYIGHRFGPAVFSRQDSRIFKPEYVEKTRGYFERYGALTLIISRFVPIVRTFVPTMAGAGRMDFRLFTLYNVIGALIWCTTVPAAGYYLGRLFPPEVLDKYILAIILGVIVVSGLSVAVELLRRRVKAS
ncbi:DedA family protein [Deinococcus peraridilitoris]|uniref:DedA family protein n=1 Tax=Deinococcus peraridilitoris TaxID=432329 RepID=UPI001FE076AA|nr:DedA family protein [Deinococcus peraridilitoris]